MILNKVKEIIERQGLTPVGFSKLTGVAKNTAYNLSRDPKHFVSGQVLDTICNTFDLQVSDVIVHVKDRNQ